MLVALVCLFFYKCIAGGRFLFSSEDFLFYYPNQTFFAESLKEGVFPFWNPRLVCGAAFFADITHGVLYPPHYLWLALPGPAAMTAVIIAEVFLGAFFLYLFLRETGRSFWASMIGGISFALSGPLLLLTRHIAMLGAICWIGAVFYCFQKSIRSRKLTWAAAGGFFLALSVFAGGIHASYMIIFALFFYFGFRFVIDIGNSPLRALKRVLLPFCVILVFAGGLTAVQTVPGCELYGRSAGGADALQFTGPGEMPPAALVNILFPKFWGSIGRSNVWNDKAGFAAYFGMAGALFGALSLLRVKDKSRWFFFMLALASLLIALGSHGRLFYGLYRFLPGFKIFRNPSVYLALFAFSGSICAALGFDCVLEAREKTGRESRNFFIFILAVSTVVLMLLVALRYFHFGSSRSCLALLGVMTGQEQLNAAQARLIYEIIFISILHASGSAALISFFSIQYCLGLIHKAVFIFLIVAGLCADLFLIGAGFITTADEKTFSSRPELISKIPVKADFRVASFSSANPSAPREELKAGGILDAGEPGLEAKGKKLRGRVERLSDNELMKWGLYTPGGYNRFNLERYARFMEIASGRDTLNTSRISSDIPDAGLRNYLNIKYLITDTQSRDDSLRMTASTADYFLYENPRALPRAFFVDEVIAADDGNEAFEVLKERNVDFSRQAVVESAGRTLGSPAGKGASVKLAKISPNGISFEIDGVQKESFCVVTETYFPGWRAFADGKEIPIYRTNGAFRGLFIPAGCRDLTMMFIPNHFYAALAVSLFFFALFLFIIAWSSIRRRRPVIH